MKPITCIVVERIEDGALHRGGGRFIPDNAHNLPKLYRRSQDAGSAIALCAEGDFNRERTTEGVRWPYWHGASDDVKQSYKDRYRKRVFQLVEVE